MARQAADRYETDEFDGMRTELVGPWSREKHDRLRKYVDITRKTRAKFAQSGSTYLDLYCGPGRAKIRGQADAVDGSTVLAAREAAKEAPFKELHIADMDAGNVACCELRLRSVATTETIFTYQGKAEQTAKEIVQRLHPNGLHLAFLDPYSLKALPFEVIETLAGLKRMDMIIHVSEMDLNRNIRSYRDNGVLESFCPGCVQVIDWRQKDEIVRREVFLHWKSKLEALGYHVGGAERVTGDKNQPFYWLVSVSRHDLGKKFWDEIRHVEPQRGFDFS
jgi:three-Cys-motif partner protein